MSNLWSDLLQQNDGDKSTPSRRIVIVCSPTIESLRSFEKTFLPPECEFSNHSMHSIGFTSTNLRKGLETEELVHCELYSILFPVQEIQLEQLEAFIDLKSSIIKWWFLLDWSLVDQKFWLRKLHTTVRGLKISNTNLKAGSITINCIHTDHIYKKQKNTTDWHSNHVEFLQQTLRSFSLIEQCSLVYSDPTGSIMSGIQLLGQLLVDNYREIQSDFISASKILIPYGSDTPGLIKTLDESFKPSEIQEDEFITQKFEKFIPGRKLQADQEEQEEADHSIQEGEYDINHPYTVDIQLELSKLHERSKQQFATKGK